MEDWQRALLQELLTTYGPGGQEDAVRDVCARELAPLVDELQVDPAGNLVGRVRGRSGTPRLRVMAHLDELSMIVKRVDAEGVLHVAPLGTMYPANFGLGPVSLLGDRAELTGVLAVGSEHTTKESPRIWETKPDRGGQSLDWRHVYVFTGTSADELAEAGVHAGTRVCIHRSKRTLVDLGRYVGSYFLDDRAALLVVVTALRRLREGGRVPDDDVLFVLTTGEEMGGIGASYASRTLPGDLTLALDVGPAEEEYATTVSPSPIVAYADEAAVYDKPMSDRLVLLGGQLGVGAVPAVFGSYESDASQSAYKGQAGRAALMCVPTLATHGYEVVHEDVVGACADLLAAFACSPV